MAADAAGIKKGPPGQRRDKKMDPQSAGLGALITGVLTAGAVAINRIFGDPKERMAHQLALETQELKREEQEHQQTLALHRQALALVEALQDRVKTVEDLLTSQTQQISAQAQQISSLVQQLDVEREASANYRAELEKARDEIHTLQARVAELETELAAPPAAKKKKRSKR